MDGRGGFLPKFLDGKKKGKWQPKERRGGGEKVSRGGSKTGGEEGQGNGPLKR